MAEVTASRRTRLWAALGTQRAVRIVTVLMLVYALVIGALVFGYAKVQSCVTNYSNVAAQSTKARADAAAEDRRLNDAEGRLDDSDRAVNRANSKALSAVVQSFVDGDRAVTQAKFQQLLATDKVSAKTLDDNEKARQLIRSERAQIENLRRMNPPPPPPSETC
jgi:hypothetical protein